MPTTFLTVIGSPRNKHDSSNVMAGYTDVKATTLPAGSPARKANAIPSVPAHKHIALTIVKQTPVNETVISGLVIRIPIGKRTK